MMVTFVSQCQKNALKKTRRVLDAFADRIGDNTWQTVITEEGLQAVRKLLRKTASKNTAVSCHRFRSRASTELMWVVGRKNEFDLQGRVPVNITDIPVAQYIDQYSWRTAKVISHAASIAGLFHDFGKANRLFQKKINPDIKTDNFEPYRHEWISLRLFQTFVNDKSDKQWLECLNEINVEMLGECFRDGVDSGFGKHPISTLPAFARLVAWIIVSHHRLPLVPVWEANTTAPKLKDINNWLKVCFDAQWNSYRCKDNDQKARVAENWSFSEKTLPYHSFKWRSYASHIASKALEQLPLWYDDSADYINDHLFTGHLARLSMMLADRYYSSQSEVTQKWRSRDYTIYANTYDKKDIRKGFKQQLDEHLIGVSHHSSGITKALPKLNQSLTSLPDVAFLNLPVSKKDKSKYGWQDKAKKLATMVGGDTKTQGFFGINMASTGRGKTIANAKIMYTLGQETGRARFSVALGLRTLTLQTGREFRDAVKLNDEQLAIAVGGAAVKQLFEHAHRQTDADQMNSTGSESADEALNDEAYVHYTGDTSHSLSHWTEHDERINKLLCAPVLVCTIDHLISATEGTKGGRQTAAMLRLLTSDLVLDEPDDFGLDDLPALCRLVHWAGMLGSRVLLSTATMPPALSFALYESYKSGWTQYAKANISDWNGEICCAWFDEFTTSDNKNRSVPDLKSYKEQHYKFVSQRIKSLASESTAENETKRLGEIAEIEREASETISSAFSATIHSKMAQLHRDHHSSKNGKHVSIGLVRMANINPLISVAKALMAMSAPNINAANDTCVHICVYHSRYPLAVRSYIEQQLDITLNRKAPNAIWQAGSPVQRVLEQHPQKHHIFVVLASPVAEVGRDHDYDWAIVEPSSMRSIIQLAGRVLRHRNTIPTKPNVVLLNKNYKAMKGEGICFNRPGFELKKAKPWNAEKKNEIGKIEKQLQLSSHDLFNALHEDQYEAINAITRIALPEKYETNQQGQLMNLSSLEHKALAWQLFTGEKKAKIWWDSKPESKPYWCGEVQRQQRFRNSKKDEAYYLWFESHYTKPCWRWLNESVTPAKFGEAPHIKCSKKLTLGQGMHFWFDQSPEAIYQELSDELGMELADVSFRFSELRVTEYRAHGNEEYQYHNGLGLFQEMESNE